MKDDAQALAREVSLRPRRFVIGAYTPYSSLDARTKTFMERMYCLRHQTGFNRGKIGAAVITTAVPAEIQACRRPRKPPPPSSPSG